MTEDTRTALDALEAGVAAVERDELPDLLGRLETIKGRAWARLSSPVPQPASPIQVAPEPKPAEHLLTAEQAAERLGRSKWWVYRHRRELPHVVLPGGRAAYSAVRLERWLRERSNQ